MKQLARETHRMAVKKRNVLDVYMMEIMSENTQSWKHARN